MNPLSAYRKLIINTLLTSCIFALLLLMAADMTAMQKKEAYYTYKAAFHKNQTNELNILEMMRMKFLMIEEW